MLKKVQEMQANMARVQQELKELRVEGSAAGGLVTATVNGHREVVDVKIDPDAIADDDLEMLEDLIVAAVAAANEAAAGQIQDRMSSAAGGLLPPGMDLGSLLGQL
jgi:DNA-binding YbaB/EbfC family protein